MDSRLRGNDNKALFLYGLVMHQSGVYTMMRQLINEIFVKFSSEKLQWYSSPTISILASY